MKSAVGHISVSLHRVSKSRCWMCWCVFDRKCASTWQSCWFHMSSWDDQVKHEVIVLKWRWTSSNQAAVRGWGMVPLPVGETGVMWEDGTKQCWIKPDYLLWFYLTERDRSSNIMIYFFINSYQIFYVFNVSYITNLCVVCTLCPTTLHGVSSSGHGVGMVCEAHFGWRQSANVFYFQGHRGGTERTAFRECAHYPLTECAGEVWAGAEAGDSAGENDPNHWWPC